MVNLGELFDTLLLLCAKVATEMVIFWRMKLSSRSYLIWCIAFFVFARSPNYKCYVSFVTTSTYSAQKAILGELFKFSMKSHHKYFHWKYMQNVTFPKCGREKFSGRNSCAGILVRYIVYGWAQIYIINILEQYITTEYNNTRNYYCRN